MRYLVLTDIHANLEALDSCLADARDRGFDRTLVLGDIVGYGADPNTVIDRVQALEPAAMVRGNHDKVACGLEQPDGFNVVAKSAALWTFEALTPEHRTWLAAVPKGPHRVDDLIEICHGSPFDEDAYIFDELDAIRALKASERPLCLFGHTHYQITWEQTMDAREISVDSIGRSADVEQRLTLRDRVKYLVNPGAVGQPRDSDPRAAYAIVDTDGRHVEMIRLPYRVEEAQAKVIRAGLPEVLAQRLAVGR
jgi:diadenosine tetraphosphatase ApaH/serine/threonine PP2A family protein phosphatase